MNIIKRERRKTDDFKRGGKDDGCPFCGVSTICSYESIYDNKYCWMNIFTTGIDSKSLKETVFRGMMNKGYHHMV